MHGHKLWEWLPREQTCSQFFQLEGMRFDRRECHLEQLGGADIQFAPRQKHRHQFKYFPDHTSAYKLDYVYCFGAKNGENKTKHSSKFGCDSDSQYG